MPNPYNPPINVPDLFQLQAQQAPMFTGQQGSQFHPLQLMMLAEIARMGQAQGGGTPGQGSTTVSPFEGATNAESNNPNGAGGGGSLGGGSFGVGNVGMGQPWSGGFLPGGNGLPAWMTNQNLPPGMGYGTEGGLALAENGGRIGAGVGAATGIPLLGMLGNYLGNQYIDNNVFQSPADLPQSGLSQAIDSYVGDSFNDRARQSSSQGYQRSAPSRAFEARQRINHTINRIWGGK